MSLTNKIVANIKKTSINMDSFLNSENVICIDTSHNRIGINTKNPEYSIDISGDSSLNAVKSHNLIITNFGKINEISSNIINTKDISCINIDVSFGNIIEASFNNINTNYIKINDICLNFAYIPIIKSDDISGTNLEISNIAIINEISAVTIKVKNINIPQANIQDINNVNSANILSISNEFITSNEISCNNLYVKNTATFFNESSFNTIDISNLGTFETISGNTIICKDFTCNDQLTADKIQVTTSISADSIDANAFTSNGIQLIKDGALELKGDNPSLFINLTISNELLVNNILDVSNIIVSKKLDLSSCELGFILPKFNDISLNNLDGNFAYDYTNNIIKLYNNNNNSNNWNNIFVNQQYATFELNNDNTEISGNDISYTVYNNTEIYRIVDSYNLLLSSNGTTNYKYIPLRFKTINGIELSNNNFDISSSTNFKTLKIVDLSGIYELNINVGLQYLNNYPGDVEPNKYSFGIYSDKSSSNLDNDIYIKTNNTIIAFDNSYNYANSHLNYIGPLLSDTNGFNFYISSMTDVSFLAINNFSGTIKLLNY